MQKLFKKIGRKFPKPIAWLLFLVLFPVYGVLIFLKEAYNGWRFHNMHSH